jgi:hypothetical protein
LAPNLPTRIRAIEQFFLHRKPYGRRDQTILTAVRAMRVVHGAISIRSLAAGLGVSQDRLEKRFRQIVGTTPKQYCSILRLPPGGRVLIASSGAAFVTSPKIVRGLRLSGGYTGAKRTLWLMAHFANSLSDQRKLGIRFQVLVPLQMVGNTKFLQHVAGAYARMEGITIEAHLEARYGEPFSEREYAHQVVALLFDERFTEDTAFGFKSHSETIQLD